MSIGAAIVSTSIPATRTFKKFFTIAYLLAAQNHYSTKAFVQNFNIGKAFEMRARLPRKAANSALATLKQEVVAAIKVEVETSLPTKKAKKEGKKLKEEIIIGSAEVIEVIKVEVETSLPTKKAKKEGKNLKDIEVIKVEVETSLPTKKAKKEGKKLKEEIIIGSAEVIEVIKVEVGASLPAKAIRYGSDHILSGSVLIELGELTSMVVVQRPSQSIKTPYVADLIMKSAEYNRVEFLISSEKCSSAIASAVATEGMLKKTKKDSMKEKADAKIALSSALRQLVSSADDIHLGHTPALDCAGMIVPGAVVYCTPNDGHTKTKFTVQLCEEQREDGGVVTVACHPNLAERAARVLLENHLLTTELGNYDASRVLRQQTFGNSRVDFVVQNEEENSITLVEVKNVVGADYREGSVPPGRCEVGVYSVIPKEKDGSDYKRHAIFPHGSKKAEVNVVSDRAIKHIHELTCMQGTIDSQGRSVKSAILLIINRSDCEAFRPCHEADMLFAQMLLRAQEKGVLIIAKEVIWTSGTAISGRSLPIAFDISVTSDIDEEHLQRVLIFNESGSGRSPSPSKKKLKKEFEDDEDEDDGTIKLPQNKKMKKEL